MGSKRHAKERGLALVATALMLVVAACDTSVTNPGPTPDEFLDAPVSQGAVLAGAQRAFSDALNTDRGGFILYWVAALAFEINPAGSTGSFGITPQVQEGLMDDIDSDFNWDAANEARFTAEDGFDRFTDPARAGGSATDAIRAQLALFAAYSNRLLGETFCDAVIPPQADGKQYPAAGDGFGSRTSHLDYFTRAEEWFTTALNLGTGDVATAARAGRASVRASLATYGQASWTDAASDAAQVPDAFTYKALYSDQDQDQFSALVWANRNSPYRAHTQWATFAEAFGTCANCAGLKRDPRMAFDSTTMTGDAGVAKFGGQVAWFPQRKYPDVKAGVNLSSGWEARLIEAEAALEAGNPGTAADFMNLRRTNLGLTPYSNTVSADSAWTLLKRERQFELWLEGRRLSDIRRWTDNSVAGNLADGLYDVDGNSDGVNDTRSETMFAPVARSLCFPIGRGERETNPNVS